MKFNGLWTALVIVVLGVALSIAGLFANEVVAIILGWGVIGIGVISAIGWVYTNLSNIARKTGEIAAKGANHVDTFKEAFKDGRNRKL